MEEARYWMLTKHRQPSSNMYDSWEEQAFAEDSACIWPPRSYSCTFCRREFRSAQALGGHMNVHRRDRARLKQSPLDQAAVLQQDIIYSNNVNYPPPPPPPPPHDPPITEVLDFFPCSKYASVVPRDENKVDFSSVGLNLFVRRDVAKVGCKRKEISSVVVDDLSSFPLFLKRSRMTMMSTIEGHNTDRVKTDVDDDDDDDASELSRCSRDDLDLELRLGDPPTKDMLGIGEYRPGARQYE